MALEDKSFSVLQEADFNTVYAAQNTEISF